MGTENGMDEPTTPTGSIASLEVEGNSKDVEDERKLKKEETVGRVPFHKLFSFADSTDIVLMFLGSIGAVANGVCMPSMSIIFGDLVDSFGKNQVEGDIVKVVSKVSLKYIYLAIGVSIAACLQVACWMVTGERQAARIRNLYLKTILRQDIGFFDKESNTGEVVGRMSGDTVLIQDAMGEKVGKFLQLMSIFIGGFVIAFIRGWLLTLVMLATIPVLVGAGVVIAVTVAKMATKGQTAYAKAAVVVEQTLGSIRTVASFTGEKKAIARYNEALESAYKASVFEGFASGMGLGAILLLVFGSYGLAVWYGAILIIKKGYTGGVIVNVIIAVLTGATSLPQATPCLSAFAAGQAAAYKMFETIKRKPIIDVYDPKGEVLDDIHGDIELRNVSFSYPARPGEQIFSGFSLTIPSGITAALVGQSGSGKSTVISLIERFYDPSAGEVLIDGINFKDFQLKWTRQKIGLVGQEPALFALSIKESIAYGKDDATLEETRAATELANAAKFIDKLPQGLDTLVGEHGTQLSGGQKQRIAIARAILKNPRILLLDEATSALDAESEKIVQDALDRIMVSRTTVIVAHRLSTVRNADMIAVIHRGKVVEKGRHSKLLENPGGAYSQLVRLQEMNRQPEQQAQEVRDVSRQSSQKVLSMKSLSRASSGRSNSSRHSFSFMFGVVVDPPESTLPESDDPTLSSWDEASPEVSIGRIASLNKPEIPMLFLGVISASINGVIFPIFGILLSSVIKIFFYTDQHELRKESRFWALMFFVLGLVSLLANPTRTYFFGVAGGRLIQRIRAICFEKVVNMEVGWFDDPAHSSGAIGARLSADAASVRALVGRIACPECCICNRWCCNCLHCLLGAGADCSCSSATYRSKWLHPDKVY